MYSVDPTTFIVTGIVSYFTVKGVVSTLHDVFKLFSKKKDYHLDLFNMIEDFHFAKSMDDIFRDLDDISTYDKLHINNKDDKIYNEILNFSEIVMINDMIKEIFSNSPPVTKPKESALSEKKNEVNPFNCGPIYEPKEHVNSKKEHPDVDKLFSFDAKNLEEAMMGLEKLFEKAFAPEDSPGSDSESSLESDSESSGSVSSMSVDSVQAESVEDTNKSQEEKEIESSQEEKEIESSREEKEIESSQEEKEIESSQEEKEIESSQTPLEKILDEGESNEELYYKKKPEYSMFSMFSGYKPDSKKET